MTTLRELKPGESGRIEEVGGEGALRQHFLDMGLIPGCDVTVVKLAPMGDPMELMIRGYELTLRLDDAAQIRVSPTEKAPEEKETGEREETPHPGLGEEGIFHPKGTGDPAAHEGARGLYY